jgi:3-oxoacyl-[acyl-carrier-protein] synthase II
LQQFTALDKERVAVVMGNGSGAINTMDEQAIIGRSKGYRKVTPFLIPMIIPDTASGHISVELGLQGPHFSMATACATGADCIGNAMRMIQSGEVDAAIAGGAEAGITALGIAGFMNARALSTRNNDPRTASRPFDKDRDGFVMGEGGCAVVLESLEHATARGATILGEVLGYGRTSDGYEVTSPRPDGNGSVRAMRLALKEAGLEPSAIDYINAHATSTPLGDTSEANAVIQVFGARAADGAMPVSSTKSMTGHMLGAAGAIEAVASLLTLRDQIIPPSLNIAHQDPAITLDTVPNTARKVSGFKYAMSNSFGFFGHNASLIVALF